MKPVLSVIAALLPLAVMAMAQEVTVVTTFDGNKGPSWKQAADISGAVGPRHVVDFDGGGFVVHEKATGKVLQHLTPREFWNHVEPSIDPQKEPNDPKIIYDPLSERWFATSAGTTPGKNLSYLAVSTGADPTLAWKGGELPIPPADPGLKIGVDRNGLYICAYNGKKDFSECQNCYAIPKADAIAPGGPVLTHIQTLTNLQYAAYPAMDLDPDKPVEAPAILMNNEFSTAPTSDKLYLYKITWNGLKAGISEAQTIPLSKAISTSRQMDCLQPAPGQKIRADSGRRTDSIYVHGASLFGCHSAKTAPNTRVGIVWYEVRIKDGALLQEGFVDAPDSDYLFPSLAVDDKGNVGIGGTRMSETEFPSVYVMMRAAADPPNTMRPPVLAVKGTTHYRYSGVGAVNWSHYSSTCVDPSDPSLLWTYQAYSNSAVDKQWCAAWVAFKFSATATKPATSTPKAAEGPAKKELP